MPPTANNQTLALLRKLLCQVQSQTLLLMQTSDPNGQTLLQPHLRYREYHFHDKSPKFSFDIQKQEQLRHLNSEWVLQ